MYNSANLTNKLAKLPKLLLCLIFIISSYGFLILYSVGGNQFEPWASKQVVKFFLFLPVMLAVSVIDIRKLYQYSYLFYISVILLLIGVELFGHVAMGAKRWLTIGGLRFQPSEPTKLAVILFLARYFHDLKPERIGNIIYLIPAILGVFIPAALIIKQPDLGTGMVILIVSGMLFFTAGVRLWKFAVVIGVILIAFPVIWHNLHDYQKQRVEVFLNPEHDPLGSGYNIIQSKIAIGSGGLTGKGLGEGTQSHLSFLPEHQTDFIFACLSEDLGLIGGLVLLILYTITIFLSLSISINAKAVFAKLLAAGITCIFFSHIFINIGMVSGLLPVVGIPLPLISYGGAMMVSILMGFGLIINVHIHQYYKF